MFGVNGEHVRYSFDNEALWNVATADLEQQQPRHY